MKASAMRRHSRRSFVFVLMLAASLVALPAVGVAQEDDTAGDDQAAVIELGFETYATNCTACHQAGGIGIRGTFPPLLDNPRVQDTEYLVATIRNGRQGPLTVDGVDYDGQMPPFPTLSDEQVDALVAYIQSGFVLPAGPAPAEGDRLPLATGTLPELSAMAIVAAFAIAVAAAAFVLAPRIIGPVDRLTMPWLDAWLRAGIIVVFFVGATVFVPSMIMQTETVTRLDRPVQDVIGSGLWLGALAAGLLGLWYAHRENRI